MTLHDAIQAVLMNTSNSNFKEIANAVNKERLYSRKDGEPVSPSQIAARISQYPEMFKVSDGIVSLKSAGLKRLKEVLDSINEMLVKEKKNTDIIGILLPAISVLLKFGNPGSFIYRYYDDYSGIKNEEDFDIIYKVLEDKYPDAKENSLYQLIEEFERVDSIDRFKGLLQPAISVLISLEKKLQIKIIDEILYSGSVIIIPGKEDSPPDNLEEYSIQNIPEAEFQNFFLKLINEYNWKKGVHNQAGSTPIVLVSIISKLIDSKDGDVLFDPFIGKGSLVAEISRDKDQVIMGGDIDDTALIIARLNFAVQNIKNFHLENANALTDWSRLKPFADWFISNPPLLSKVTRSQFLFEGYGSSHNFFDIVVKMAIYHTKENGKSCIIVPQQVLFSETKANKKLKAFLIQNNYLDAIICLPTGSFAPYSQMRTAILILDKGRNTKARSKSFFYDLNNIAIGDLAKEFSTVAKLYKEFKTNYYTDNDHFIDIQTLVENDYSFNYKRLRNNLSFDPIEYKAVAEVLHKTIKPHTGEVLYGTAFTGNVVPKENLSKQGTPYLQVNELRPGSSISDDHFSIFVNDLTYIRPKFVKRGSILLARVGENLKPTLYTGKSEILVSSNIICLTINTELVLPEFVLSEFQEAYFEEQVKQIRTGIALQSFRIDDFVNLKLWIPSLEKQGETIDSRYANKPGLDSHLNGTGYVLAELAHKMRGPLGSIKAATTRLDGYIRRKAAAKETVSLQDLAYNLLGGQDPEEFKNIYSVSRTLQNIISNVDRINGILKRANNLESIASSAIEMEGVTLIDLLKKDILPAYYQKFIISITAKHNTQVRIKADKSLLSNIFENLLDNAFVHGFGGKYSETSMVNIYWEVKKSELENLDDVIVFVENNGAVSPRLTMETFTRKGFTSNSVNGGMGIGGAFIQKALTQMGGSLIEVGDITEKLGGYTMRFSFKLQKYEPGYN